MLLDGARALIFDSEAIPVLVDMLESDYCEPAANAIADLAQDGIQFSHQGQYIAQLTYSRTSFKFDPRAAYNPKARWNA